MRILLVEDDTLVREAVADDLREVGLEVIEAASGDEALAHCGRPDVAVLVTDIRMPGRTNGWDLAETCRRLSPGMAVIYITGYSDVPERQVVGSHLLWKPFRLEHLRALVQNLLPGGL